MKRHIFFLSALLFFLSGCLESLAPEPEDPNPTGTIYGRVTYKGDWPPASQLNDIRFVAMRFVPQRVDDIFSALLTGELVSSAGLRRNVDVDTFSIKDVPNGRYVYNGVARQFGGLIDWDALGVLNGVINIQGNEVFVDIQVDFDNLPPFPPENAKVTVQEGIRP